MFGSLGLLGLRLIYGSLIAVLLFNGYFAKLLWFEISVW